MNFLKSEKKIECNDLPKLEDFSTDSQDAREGSLGVPLPVLVASLCTFSSTMFSRVTKLRYALDFYCRQLILLTLIWSWWTSISIEKIDISHKIEKRESSQIFHDPKMSGLRDKLTFEFDKLEIVGTLINFESSWFCKSYPSYGFVSCSIYKTLLQKFCKIKINQNLHEDLQKAVGVHRVLNSLESSFDFFVVLSSRGMLNLGYRS